MDNYDYLKYGTIVIKYNYGFIYNLYKDYSDYEIPTDESEIVIHFEDNNNVYDKKDIISYNHLIFPEKKKLCESIIYMPYKFTKNGKNFFYKDPKIEDGVYKISIGSLFVNYFKNKKIIKKNCKESLYNCIYYKNEITDIMREKNVFSILRAKTTGDTNRYIFAYDPDTFEEKDILNILKNIFIE